MTRFLVLGDHTGTGFGTVTRDLGSAFIARGDDVRFVSFNEQTLGEELPEPLKGRTFELGHPTGWVGFFRTREEVAETLARIGTMFTGEAWKDAWTPEAVIVIGDPASVERSPVIELLPEGLPAFHYVAIEGIELPPRWGRIWQRLQPVAMSQFGALQIEMIYGKPVPFTYHGVDTSAFYPVSPLRPIVVRLKDGILALKTKEDCRKFVATAIAQTRNEKWAADPLRETWLFRADRNVPRKRYPSLFRSIAPVLHERPNARLLFHCGTIDEGGNLENDLSKYVPSIASRMMSTGFHDRYNGVERTMLAAMYNAADIYVSVSAEGFGLTIAEAMACGVPAVGLHFSSVPEVIGNTSGVPGEGSGGYTVPVGMLMENIYSHWWAGVNETEFAKQVLWLVDHPKRRRELGFLAAMHVARAFTWEGCAKGFADLVPAPVVTEVSA